jgi:hypothetical protein
MSRIAKTCLLVTVIAGLCSHALSPALAKTTAKATAKTTTASKQVKKPITKKPTTKKATASKPPTALGPSSDFDLMFTREDDVVRANALVPNRWPVAQSAKAQANPEQQILGSGTTSVSGLKVPWVATSGEINLLFNSAAAQCLVLPDVTSQFRNGICVAPPGPLPTTPKTGLNLALGPIGVVGYKWRDPELNGDLVMAIATNKRGIISNVKAVNNIDRQERTAEVSPLPNSLDMDLFSIRLPSESGKWTLSWTGEQNPGSDPTEVNTSAAKSYSWDEGATEVETGLVDGEVKWLAFKRQAEYCGATYTGTTPLSSIIPNCTMRDGTSAVLGSRTGVLEAGGRTRTKQIFELTLSPKITAVKLQLTGKASAVVKIVPEQPNGSPRLAFVVVYDQIGPLSLTGYDNTGTVIWSDEQEGYTPDS